MVRIVVGIILIRVVPIDPSFQDIPVNYLVIRLLEQQEIAKGFLDVGGLDHLEGCLDEGVHVPDPDFGIAAAGVVAFGQQFFTHLLDFVKCLVGEDGSGQFGVTVVQRIVLLGRAAGEQQQD